ncbi:hypothetical protein LUZ60_005735 [Juncus effusus]|nr:hypothetical protein LUZ60_005735 [Juncus effusus]
MARFTCFSTLLVGKKKKSSKESKKFNNAKQPTGTEKPKVKPEELFLEVPVTNAELAKNAELARNAELAVKTETNHQKPDQEKDKSISLTRNSSNDPLISNGSNGSTRLASPKLLKRSCSNIERRTKYLTNSPNLNLKKPHSYDDLKNIKDFNINNSILKEREMKPDSPLSVKSSCSADKIMLKKRSSSQVLPSRSRKLWWRLFMWSHRNDYNNNINNNNNICNYENINDCGHDNKGGYNSDTVEIMDNEKRKEKMDDEGNNNEWVAFNAETSYFDRVNAWVNSIPNENNNNNNNETDYFNTDNYYYNNVFAEEEEEEEGLLNKNEDNFCIGESSSNNKDQIVISQKRRGGDEIAQANDIIQSLNVLSNVAHISGMGLKVVPIVSAFTSLKAVNLSNNFIVNITAGALPKSLHTLDLSRNKIGNIEGLRELTRLRVLDLSYNRISRIGHGLSNCTAIKELYLAGNKISNVEGLHRLLKLTVLDLSFNKITTTKSLGQLVANYNSLLALNILGNPIQTNIGDDQLKKSVLGLLPKLTYMNKQLINKAQRGREIGVSDRVAKAALGSGQWGGASRRKPARRSGHSSSGHSGSGSVRGAGSGRGEKGKMRYRK